MIELDDIKVGLEFKLPFREVYDLANYAILTIMEL